MAQFDFEADGTETANSYSPVPAGEYVLRCVKATYKKTSTNKHMLNLELEVSEGPYEGRKVWTNVVFNPKGEAGHGLTVQALKAFGFEYDGKLRIDTDDWETRSCRASLDIENYEANDGTEKQRNVIPTAGFITGDEDKTPAPKATTAKTATKTAKATTAKDTEKVPF